MDRKNTRSQGAEPAWDPQAVLEDTELRSRIQALIDDPKGGVLRVPGAAPDDVQRVVIYARRSKKGGHSVEDQTWELLEDSADEGWCVVAVVVEHGSASEYARRERPHWLIAKGLIASGEANILATWENSRADRKLRGYVELREALIDASAQWWYGGKLYDMSDPDDRNRTASDALDSEKESDKISKRNRRTTRRMAAAGRPHGELPFGYRRIRDDKTAKIAAQVPDETTAPVVREIAERVLARESLMSIARDLNQRKILTVRGGTWSNSNLRAMIMRPCLAGLRVHNGEVTGPATWEPILAHDRNEAEKIHHQIVAVLSHPSRRTQLDTTAKHLCSGLARCGEPGCGAKCYVKLVPNGKDKRRSIYYCPKGHVGRSQPLVDEIVTKLVLGILSDPDCADLFQPTADVDVAAALAEVKRLREELDGWYVAAARKRISEAGLMRIEQELLPQIERAEVRARPVPVPPIIEEIAGEQAEERWKELTIEQKRTVVRVVADIHLDRTKRGRYVDPQSVRVKPKVAAVTAA